MQFTVGKTLQNRHTVLAALKMEMWLSVDFGAFVV